MRIVSWFAAAAALAVLLQGGPPDAAVSQRVAAALRAIDGAMADVVPALVVAVTDRTRTLGVVARGYADIKTKRRVTPDSLFEIGSIGKSFTSMALMELFDEGRFDPQAPVSTYLPWFTVRSSPSLITGHHLLTHTAGLPNYRPDLASAEFATYALRDYDVPYAPGSHYWYSNTGFQTLGYVLERLDQRPYHSIIEGRILSRIGMSATVAVIDDKLRARLPVSYMDWPYDDELVEQPWFEYRAADGAIASTGADMAAYVRVILNRGALPTGRLVSERAFDLMTTPALDGYAYGLRVRHVDGDTIIGHKGAIAGFGSVMEAHMNDGYGIVLLTNGRPSSELGMWILDAVKAAMRNRPLPEWPPKKTEAGSGHDWAGVYRSSNGDTVEFVDVRGELALKRGASTIRLTQIGEESFRASAADLVAFPFVFERQGGKVVEVSHGPDWYVSAQYTGPTEFQMPPEYEAYIGRYENHSPEEAPVRIFVNRGQLMAAGGFDEGGPLVAVGPALFKPATPDFNPERYAFDSMVDGHALRLIASGMPMYRVNDQ